MISRRQFFKLGAATVGALALSSKVSLDGPSGLYWGTPVALAFYQSLKLQKFVMMRPLIVS